MRLLLKAPLNRMTGYGNDGVDIARWLSRLGVDVTLIPGALIPPIPEEVAMLLTKPIEKTGYDVAMQFLPPFDISVRERVSVAYRQRGIPKYSASVHVGWSMWETDMLTREDMTGHGLGANPWKLLDVMYVTWPGCVDTFKHYDPNTEYRVMPCGIDGDLFPVSKRTMDGPTRFCMIGELHLRKDPFVAIEAFNELCRETDWDAELHLKTSTFGLHPKLHEWNERVYVHSGVWGYDELIKWMGHMTCYVGPSRGEGNLKPPMEFMATGGTAIVTNWSGPTNWLHPDVSYPLDYTMAPLDPNKPDGPKNARASKEHLKELMWRVHTDRAEAAMKGKQAAQWIREVADWRVIMPKMISQLEQLVYHANAERPR